METNGLITRIFFKHPRLMALPLAAFLVGCAFNSAKAVPADPTPREVTQPDGTKIQVRLRGDEFFHWTETPNGYAVVTNPISPANASVFYRLKYTP